METKKKWYQRAWGIIALLILFFPAGLYLMWKYSGWKPVVKWIVSGLFAFLVLANMSGGKNKETSQFTPTLKQEAKTEPTSTPKSTKHELDATVNFSDEAFRITNNEEQNWENCRLELNAGIIRGGYVYNVNVIVAKNARIIPFREFTKGDGTRFNSYDTKPQSLSISCDVNGENGFNYFGIQ